MAMMVWSGLKYLQGVPKWVEGEPLSGDGWLQLLAKAGKKYSETGETEHNSHWWRVIYEWYLSQLKLHGHGPRRKVLPYHAT